MASTSESNCAITGKNHGPVPDCAVSVGMVEHVGFKNHRAYLRTVADSLGREGRFLCQGICNPISRRQLDPWIERYIFPNSVLPSLARLTKAAGGSFRVEEVLNFGPHYDPTLMAREENSRRAWLNLRRALSPYVAHSTCSVVRVLFGHAACRSTASFSPGTELRGGFSVWRPSPVSRSRRGNARRKG